MNPRLLLWLSPVLLTLPAYGDVEYLIGTAVQEGYSIAYSMNSQGLVVGTCSNGTSEPAPCYWDLNEAPHQVVYPYTNVTATVLEPHVLPYIGCSSTGSVIVDVTDGDEILAQAHGLEGPCLSPWFTSEVPGYHGWTELDTYNSWTHTPTLQDGDWIVTNGHGPTGREILAEVTAVPEPSSIILLAVPAAALLIGRRQRRAQRRAL